MKTSPLARSTVGIAAAAAMGVATIVSAATASADMSVATSSTYCVGSTYTVTLPAADAAQLQAQATGFADFSFYDYSFTTQTNPMITLVKSYVAGQDVTVQWTPTVTGQHQLTAMAYFNPWSSTASKLIASGMINVVQNAPPEQAAPHPLRPLAELAAPARFR